MQEIHNGVGSLRTGVADEHYMVSVAVKMCPLVLKITVDSLQPYFFFGYPRLWVPNLDYCTFRSKVICDGKIRIFRLG